MTTISSHTLNGVDGSHAGGIVVTLSRTAADGSREILFSAETDDGGRLVREVDLGDADPASVYELVYCTGPYWEARNLPRQGPQIMNEVVVRLSLPDPALRYHVPLILSPNSYSVWWSS